MIVSNSETIFGLVIMEKTFSNSITQLIVKQPKTIHIYFFSLDDLEYPKVYGRTCTGTDKFETEVDVRPQKSLGGRDQMWLVVWWLVVWLVVLNKDIFFIHWQGLKHLLPIQMSHTFPASSKHLMKC